jgi:hypothetical protein
MPLVARPAAGVPLPERRRGRRHAKGILAVRQLFYGSTQRAGRRRLNAKTLRPVASRCAGAGCKSRKTPFEKVAFRGMGGVGEYVSRLRRACWARGIRDQAQDVYICISLDVGRRSFVPVAEKWLLAEVGGPSSADPAERARAGCGRRSPRGEPPVRAAGGSRWSTLATHYYRLAPVPPLPLASDWCAEGRDEETCRSLCHNRGGDVFWRLPSCGPGSPVRGGSPVAGGANPRGNKTPQCGGSSAVPADVFGRNRQRFLWAGGR